MADTLKPLAPYLIGEVFDYVDPPSKRRNFCLVSGSWFCVCTEPREERLAKGEIVDAGLVVYWPRGITRESHGNGRTRFSLRPLFPSYLFVKCEPHADHWGLITSSRGVRRLLGCDCPKSITDEEMEVIRLYETEKVEQAEAYASQLKAMLRARKGGKSGLTWHFEPGERVRIKSGPFASFYAQLEKAVDENDRIIALVDLFGRKSRTEVSAFDIEAL